MRAMRGVVAVVCTVAGLAQFSGTQIPRMQVGTSAARGAEVSSAKAPAAQNLLLTSAVRTALVAAAASYYGLTASDFVGLGTGAGYYGAYYAYDPATSTYWAGASLVPKPGSYKAEVVVQDDGAYLIFKRTSPGPWQVHEVGYSDKAGTCAAYHVTIPPSVVAVWHWAPGTCHPPLTATAPAGPPKPVTSTPPGRAPSGQPVLGSKAFIPRIGVGWGTYKPAEIFNGGDPSGMVHRITWTGWGQADAYGYGQTYIFKPNGGYYPGSVTAELRASDLGHCTVGGPLAYRHLDAREPSAPGGKLGKWFVWAGAKTLCHPYP